MPTIDLDPIQSRVIALAVQKKNATQQSAQAAFNAADAQFVADVDVIVQTLQTLHCLPDGNTPVNFHVENGKGTASWPDIVAAQGAVA